MPNINLPRVFSSGQIADGTQVAENFYAPNTTPDSLEIINGQLDNTNRETSPAWSLGKEMIQPHTVNGGSAYAGPLSCGGSAGSTMPLDFFGAPSEELGTDSAPYPSAGFVCADWEQGSNDTANLYRAIPGAALEIYLPYTPTLFVAHWQVFVSHTGDSTPGSLDYTILKLFVDDSPVTNQKRTIYPAGTSTGGASGLVRYGKEADRTWAGHYYDDGTAMQAGWHRLSLRIATDTSIARVHCRGINYIHFK